MGKQEQYFSKINEFKQQFRRLPLYKLKSRLNTGLMTKEAAIALRELIELREKVAGIPKEVNEAFYAGNLADGIRFRLNDTIEILSDEEKGKVGSVISIVTLEPEPTYMIELADGSGDREYGQSELRLHS